jgi:hypothetical protein
MADSDSEEGLTREEMQQQEEVEPPPKRAKQDACTFISTVLCPFTFHLQLINFDAVMK